MTMTFKDIAEYVAYEFGNEGTKPNPSLILSLANQALRYLSEIGRFYLTTWFPEVTAGERLVTLNDDVIEVLKVRWNGVVLTKIDRHSQDRDNPDWDWSSLPSGTPISYILTGAFIELYPTPDISTTTLCEVTSINYLPAMTENESVATTPLRYLPVGSQLAPAYYVLMHLAPRTENADHDRYRLEKYITLWNTAVTKVVEASRRRVSERFDY